MSRLSGRVWRPLGGSLRELPLVPVIALSILIGALISDAFLTTGNFLNIVQQSSELSVLVIAEAIIIIAGKFDLSLESVVGLAPMMGAWLMVKSTSEGGSGLGLNPYLAILVVLGTGMLAGVINGFFVTKMRLNAFITTLAMLILLRGITMGMTNGRTLYSLPPEYLYLGSGRWLGVPVSIWLAGLLYLFFGLFLRYHRLGRAIYAIGGNPAAGSVARTYIARVPWGGFFPRGLFSSASGWVFTARIFRFVAQPG